MSDRESIRCPHCMLVQFTIPGKVLCRRCHRPIVLPEIEEAAVDPEVAPAALKPAGDDRQHVVGANVARLRHERRLTQNQLARLMGTSRTHLNKIENSYSCATIGVVQRVATALGVTMLELLAEPPSPQLKELQAD